MPKSATDVMQEIIFSAVIDSIMGLKTASKGLPNTLLRDINAIHANTTFADLPPELQGAITASVRAAFSRLLKEGYSVAAAGAPPPRTPPRHDAAHGNRGRSGGPRPSNAGPRGARPGGGKPGGGKPGGGKPGGKPSGGKPKPRGS